MKVSLDNEYLFKEASEGIKIGCVHGFSDGRLHGFLVDKIKDIINDNTKAENVVTNFLKNLKIRWKRASRNRNYLINRNKHWLATKVYQSPLDETSAKELINTTPPTLVFATSRVLKKKEQPHLAKALSQVNTESPSTSSCNT